MVNHKYNYKFGPTKKKPRHGFIGVRLDDVEIWKLEKLANTYGTNPSALARDILLVELNKIPDPPKRRDSNGRNGQKNTKGESELFV